MDFLDPEKQRRHARLLLAGYVLIAIAILIATTILLYLATGYVRGKNGKIIQNGLVFVSSAPAGAEIRLNGKLESNKTNARLSLPEGDYTLQLDRTGYRSWLRNISIEGGSVTRFDYPQLFPKKLDTTTLSSYDAAPPLATQSPDRRWLLVQLAESPDTFEVYDLKNPKTAATDISLPATAFTSGKSSSWQLVEWSTDNRHVLLKHAFDAQTEFVMVDRTDPTQSFNLSRTLGVNPTKVTLQDKKYDQYFVYDSATQQLSRATLNAPNPVVYLEHVLEYRTYGTDIVLYASSSSSSSAKVSIDLLQGGKTYNLREVKAGTTYLLNITRYSGSWYAAIGASSESKVYIYKNPVGQLTNKLGVLTPIFILKTPNPTYLAFSSSAQYIMDENGSKFSVYDAEHDKGYSYDTAAPLDDPQVSAQWMDGDRLVYISGGKLIVFDYDNANRQTLMTASPNYLPFFNSSYQFVDTLGPNAAGKTLLSTTPLRTAADR